MSGNPTHYYIWYRVKGEPGAARAAIDALLGDVFRHAGVQGRVLVRLDDPRVWMEVYEHVVDTALFERVLAAGVEEHGAGAWAENGARHLEPFIAHY